MERDLSIIIVSYRCRDELAECLRSLTSARADALTRQTIVVDNASDDGAAEMVATDFPDVELIANPDNRGFAAANNQGIAVARGRNLLLLNPDTIVPPGTLRTLVRTLDENPDVGACGPKLVGDDGRPQRSVRRQPTLAALLHQYTPLRWLGLMRGAYRRYRCSDFDYEQSADVESLMGAALCVPRHVIDEIGPLDERFFVYFEEVDLCRRIGEAGLRCRYVAEAAITHTGGVSAGRGAASLYLARSLFRFMRKHVPSPAAYPGLVALWLGMICREAVVSVTSSLAALGLLMALQTGRARRRWRRAVEAARFVFCDAWRIALSI